MAKREGKALERLQKQIEFMNAKALRIGWITNPRKSMVNKNDGSTKMRDDKGITTPTTVAQVARAHELGRGVPMRSMIKGTFVQRRKQIGDLQARAVKAVMAGKITADVAMNIVGEGVLSLIKDRMVQGISPGLSEARKAAKVRAGRAKDTPLINWGVMLNSVRYKVVKAQ